jgi:hypothetical protein
LTITCSISLHVSHPQRLLWPWSKHEHHVQGNIW